VAGEGGAVVTPRQLLETHAKTSREALADGKPRPRLEAGAYLAGADLTDANLADANLAGADLTGANLADANLAGADRTSPPTSPYVERPRKSASERAAAYRARNPNVATYGVVAHLRNDALSRGMGHNSGRRRRDSTGI
jgi:hypothetical protein